MSEYMFGVGRKRLSERDAKRIDKVARRHGYCFVWGTFPGQGYQTWFAGPNLGHPFDQAAADEIIADLQREGLWRALGWAVQS